MEKSVSTIYVGYPLVWNNSGFGFSQQWSPSYWLLTRYSFFNFAWKQLYLQYLLYIQHPALLHANRSKANELLHKRTFFSGWGLTTFLKTSQLLGWLEIIGECDGKIVFYTAALMVLMISRMMVHCLDLCMAWDIVLTMARLTVHCLVLQFQNTMGVYLEK